MISGKMRHRLTLQNPNTTRDAGGGFVGGWLDIASDPVIWCDIRPSNGRVETQNLQTEGVVIHKIVTRYRDDINAKMRLRDAVSGRAFLIDTIIDPTERQRFLEILVKEYKSEATSY